MKDNGQINYSKIKLRKHLNADALFAELRLQFSKVKDTANGAPKISLCDNLMSAFAMFSLKDSSLLAFDRRREIEEHNLKAIYGMDQIPCDTQMRTRLDGVDPDSLRSAFKGAFVQAQRGKLLEKFTFMNGYYLVSIDGTGYFSSEKLFSPFCLTKKNSKTGKTTHHLQTLGAVIVHPQHREVIPLPPEPISNQDGQTKNDCERNACKRWLQKFRIDHPHLKVIIIEDGLASNAPHIRALKEHHCSFILGAKKGDHAFLGKCIDKAIENAEAIEHNIKDESDPLIHHRFRFVNNIALNKSNQDLLVNVLEYWETKGDKTKHFSWVTDFEINLNNAYQIMQAGRARWKVENETFNTLKNQGYNFEHNYGLGKKHLSMTFVSLMMLAFLVDQIQQIACPIFRTALLKAGSKKELWEKIRSAFHFFLLHSMEVIYRLIIAGPQQMLSIPLINSS